MMKLKYILLSLIIALSFASCESDEDTKNTDNDDGGNTDSSVLVCSLENSVEKQIIGNSLELNWGECTSTDGTDVTYRVWVFTEYFDCLEGIPKKILTQDYYIPETNITIEGLFENTKYEISVSARDVNANYEIIEVFDYKTSSNGIFEGDLIVSTQYGVNLFEGHDISTINGDFIITGSCQEISNIPPSINNLDILSGIENITGDLIIDGEYHNFTSIQFLESLIDVGGDIEIKNCTSINSLDPLKNFDPSGNITLEGCTVMEGLNMWNDNTNEVGFIRLIGLTTPSIDILNNVSSFGYFLLSHSSATNVSFLENATDATGGSIQFSYCSQLSSINGFNNINSGGNVKFLSVPLLQEINIFSSIESVNDLIFISTGLIEVDFISNLTNIYGDLFIASSPQLTTLDFTNISTTEMEGITFQDLNEITSILGLNNVQIANTIAFRNNPLLINLSDFNSLLDLNGSLVIEDNDGLTNLDALSNLNYIECPGQLIVTDNFNLGDLCGLQTLFTNNGLCSFEATIENNGYNPTPLQISNGDCSL